MLAGHSQPSIEWLSQIGLNLASVEQFLAAAQSLAEDNGGSIQGQVFEAGERVRASALLIDHLRSLFSHQRAIESSQQQQQQHQSLADSSQAVAGSNLALFTYSNQRTLIRAAKCLVSSVAKILYLTEAVVLQPVDWSLSRSVAFQAQSEASPARDRLDSVANYSQLLRSFSELSYELVDLGRCLSLARSSSNNVRAQRHHNRALCSCSVVAGSCRPAHQVELFGPLVARRCSSDQNEPLASYALDEPEELYHHQHQHALRPSASTVSMLVAAARADATPLLPPMTASSECVGANSGSSSSNNNNSKVGHCRQRQRLSDLSRWIQDMQILFQVNSRVAGSTVTSSSSIASMSGNLQQQPASTTTTSWGRAPSCLAQMESTKDTYVMAQPLWPPVVESASHSVDNNNNNSNGHNHNELQNELAQEQAFDYELEQDEAELLDGSEAAPQLQIMDYFLQTWSGTASAADAISALQTLVEPFTRVSNNEQLCQVLDAALNLRSKQALHIASSTPTQQHQLSSTMTAISMHSIRHNETVLQQAGDDHSTNHSIVTNNDDHNNNNNNNANNNSNNNNNNNNNNNDNKENLNGASIGNIASSTLLMSKRQLVKTLNALFLADLKANLTERIQEFTDCPYTKHEYRENLIALLQCLKLQLNKLVKLIYRLRRRSSLAASTDLYLNQLRQVAAQLLDTCAELSFELQSVAVEMSDDLDRCESQSELVKQLKHHSLVGDIAKTEVCCGQFYEQTEQLIEICKMLNQVAPTNKMKISTKTLAIWFELNVEQLLASVRCLSENARSRVAKDCAWAYIQVWCSFYDDFCQLARQMAYLAHANFDANRPARVTAIREQLTGCSSSGEQQQQQQQPMISDVGANGLANVIGVDGTGLSSASLSVPNEVAGAPDHFYAAEYVTDQASGFSAFLRQQQQQQHQLSHAYSSQSLDALADDVTMANDKQQQQLRRPMSPSAAHVRPSSDTSVGRAAYNCCGPMSRSNFTSEHFQQASQQLHHQQLHHHQQQRQQQQQHQQQQSLTDSPRSLDHYHGFGANYQRTYSRHYNQQVLLNNTNNNGARDMLMAVHQEAGGAAPPPPTMLHQQYDWCSIVAPMCCPPSAPAMSEPLATSAYTTSPRGGPLGGVVAPMPPPPRRNVTIDKAAPQVLNLPPATSATSSEFDEYEDNELRRIAASKQAAAAPTTTTTSTTSQSMITTTSETLPTTNAIATTTTTTATTTTASSSSSNNDKWSDSETDAIVHGARETAQMAMSMYQFTRGEGDLNTTQDLFTQAELFAEEANELYKEVRCFSYKVPAGDLKKELLTQLGTIPVLVQQLQFVVKNPTVGKQATFTKVDGVIRETKKLMEAVNRVVSATLACRQHYNMATASMRKRTRTLSPTYRADKAAFEFDSTGAGSGGRPAMGAGRLAPGSMGSEPDI